MEISKESKSKIEGAFASIGGVKAFTSFSRLTADQQLCVDTLRDMKDVILSTKGRDRYLSALITSITGASDDEDESMNEATFSQYRFYQLYVHDLRFYPEKFDFLLRCIEECVVVISQSKLFLGLLENIVSSQRVESLPDHVIHYERQLEEDEERRIESFTLRKDWTSQVVHYMDA
jgi:hypothetical protein